MGITLRTTNPTKGYTVKTRSLLVSGISSMEANVDANYGPWDSLSQYMAWLTSITTPTAVPPVGTQVSIKNDQGTEIFVYNETPDGNTSYWKDESGGVLLSETDGVANKNLLNALLASGHVKLRKGHYPLDNGVVVNSVELDLNGACLQSTRYRDSTTFILMKGSKPVVKNGELCGNYDKPVDDPTYVPGAAANECESLIRLSIYEDALIENVELHNCWGYSIGFESPNWVYSLNASSPFDSAVRKTIDASMVTAVTTANDGISSESLEYQTNFIDLPEGALFTTVYGIDYNYIVSQKEIEFTFRNAQNVQIGSTVSAIPGIMVPVPSGATKVRVKFYRYDVSTTDRNAATSEYQDETYAIFKRVQLGFYRMRVNSLTVKGCTMHNNHSLGMVGMRYGTTRVLNCRSYEQGKPSKNTAQNMNTTGFIDIEDAASPIFIMDGCTSEDELHLAMLGAYKSTVTNCHGSIGVTRGWSADISNCVGCVWSGVAEPGVIWPITGVKTIVNVSNCVFYRKNVPSVNWVGNSNTFVDCYPGDVTKENNFIIRKLHRATQDYVMPLTGLIRGKMYNTCNTSGNPGIRNIALKRGSQFVYSFNMVRFANETTSAFNNRVKQYGTAVVSGDCWGIESSMPFYPNGKTIYESTFTPSNSFGVATTDGENNKWTGEYRDCTFNLDKGSMFNGNNKKLLSSNRTLIFRNCVINNANNYLFQVNMVNLSGKNYKVLFINCTIADQNKLFKVAPADFEYEIITEDDYDTRINALLARIVALETRLQN